MYHCRIQFYFIGIISGLFNGVRDIPPLESCTHVFTESASFDANLAAQADVIFAYLPGVDTHKLLSDIFDNKKKSAELILLAGGEQDALSDGELAQVTEIWTVPCSERELKFRFQRWQRTFKSERDLWENKAFLDIALDSTPNLVWFKNKDGVHERVNESFCSAVGKTRQQVQGQHHAYIWDVDEDDPACLESEREVEEKGCTCRFEEVIKTGEGDRTLDTYKSPLYDLDGSFMGTLGVAIDVTRELSYKQEIVKKNHTLELLFSSMNCGMLCHSLDGNRIVSVNKAALRLLGYDTVREMLDDGYNMVSNSVFDEDKPKLRKCIASLKKAGDSAEVEYRVRHKDGKVVYALGNVKLIEENGELLYQRFMVDFTAQKLQAEEKVAARIEKIQYQKQLFKILTEYLAGNIDDVYIMLNSAVSELEFVSPNIERVLGVTWDELREDMGCLGYARHTNGEKISLEDLKAMQPDSVLQAMGTERINPKTGEHRWFNESIYCVTVQNQRKYIAYISDRTKERQTEKTLTEALKIAQVASKAKSMFLSNISHDIRTPLNTIMGFTTLLENESDNPKLVREYTKKISAASQHLLGLINDVLDINKIESGSAALNISEIDLAEIIDEINTIIRPQARAKKQSFEIHTCCLTHEFLLGDKVRINQILINILSNAVKYTQVGGRIEMRVNELHQVDEKYNRVQFVISDNGQGMSEEYQKVIFDRFTRDKLAESSVIQGTGLGMAITKSLVDLMNGSIEVKSKLGEGSTFTVELELRIHDKEEDEHFWSRHPIKRMIVADDDEDICLDIVRKMKNTGVEVNYATNGFRAIEMMRTTREAGHPFDLILLDWKMPDLNGLETARLIRKNYPKIPILLLSAYDWADIEDEAREVGIDHFLPKPFFMTNFKDAISRVMGGMKEEHKPAANTGSGSINGKHFLVVDDIDVNRMILVKILGTLGASCDMAENGQDALEKFMSSEPGTFDMILMDIQMPIMNGYEATRAIRASDHPEAKTVPIIAMTANAFVDDIRDSLESGMNAHIPKPIILNQLKATLQDVFDKKGKNEL